MSDKKQQETEQPRRQNKGWSWGKGIIMIVLGGFSLFICCLYLFPELICWLLLSPELICWLLLSPEQWVTNKHVWLKLYLGILAVTGVVALCKPQIITSSSEKYFITRVLVTGITGGVFALLLPIAVKSTTTGVGGLRHSILLATGGLLAILTLGETRRKNDIDKRKNKQEKKKNDKDHRRQVRAERRERYTKAVEQLGDEKAPIRMGGVYTLVGLVDEWLKDESIKKYEDRLKEGQVIINNLCAYIRSPFTLASHYDELSKPSHTPKGIYKGKKEKFYADKATLESEADVRLSIIKEIHDRLQGPEENTPGTWSDFEYDFSGSTFFYPVDLTKSYYKKPVNFSGSTYKGEANFSGSTYKGEANFSGSTYENKEKKVLFSTSDSPSIYEGKANFSHSIYQGDTDFSHSTYQGEADFSGSTYENKEKKVLFSTSDSPSIYQGEANFYGSTYEGWADFSGSTYEKDVNFSSHVPRSTYDRANFSGSTYKGKAEFSDSTYQWADFSGSTYEGEANFYNSIYKGRARFRESTYEQDVLFSTSALCSTYEGNADFSGSTYKGEADFSGSTYENKEKKVLFSTSDSPSIYEGKAGFSGSTYQGGANFTGSTYNDVADFRDSTYQGGANFTGSTYQNLADFTGSTYQGGANFIGSTYNDVADFSGSIFYQIVYFGADGDNSSFSRFTDCAPQFYDETNHKNTLFGSPNNDFSVENGRGYPIYRNLDGLPLGCKFLTSEQKEYLADKFQEIDETKNKFLKVKDPKEKEELLKKLQALTEELYEWREEATTVKVEGTAPEEKNN